jgi:hypothetical protein
MKSLKLVLPVLAVVVCCSALGAEATTTPVTVVPEWAVNLVHVILGFAATYGVWCITSLVNLIFGQTWKTGVRADAIAALEHGIQDAEEQLVAELKADTEDGKLTADEIKRAKALAYKCALEVATGPALKLLEQWGSDIAGNLISQLVQGKKTAAANTVVVNASSVDSIQAPPNTNLQTPSSEATSTVRAEVVRPKVVPKPSQEEIDAAIKTLLNR